MTLFHMKQSGFQNITSFLCYTLNYLKKKTVGGPVYRVYRVVYWRHSTFSLKCSIPIRPVAKIYRRQTSALKRLRQNVVDKMLQSQNGLQIQSFEKIDIVC